MKKNKFLRRAPRWLCAFICSLSLFGLFSLVIVKTTLFNQEFMIDKTQKAHYAETITAEINQSIGDLGRASNVPVELLAGTVTPKQTQANLDSFIRGIYTDVPFQIKQRDQIEQKITTILTDYASQQQVDLATPQAASEVDQLKTAALTEFDRHIEIPYILTYGRKLIAFNSTLMLLILVVAVITLILVIGVILVVGPFTHRKIRYLAYVVGGSGLMLTVLPGYLLLSKIVYRLGVASTSLYRFLTTYVHDFILTFVYVGGAALLTAAMLWVASEVLRKKVIAR